MVIEKSAPGRMRRGIAQGFVAGFAVIPAIQTLYAAATTGLMRASASHPGVSKGSDGFTACGLLSALIYDAINCQYEGRGYA